MAWRDKDPKQDRNVRFLPLPPLQIRRAPLSALFIGPASGLNQLHTCHPILHRRECRAELLRRQRERSRHERARELSIKVRKSQPVSFRVAGTESRCLQGFKAKLVVTPRPPHPGSLKLNGIDSKMHLKEYKLFKGGRGWLSDDTKRIPLRVEADIFIGYVFAELESVQIE